MRMVATSVADENNMKESNATIRSMIRVDAAKLYKTLRRLTGQREHDYMYIYTHRRELFLLTGPRGICMYAYIIIHDERMYILSRRPLLVVCVYWCLVNCHPFFLLGAAGRVPPFALLAQQHAHLH